MAAARRLRPSVLLCAFVLLILGFWSARTTHVRSLAAQWNSGARLGLNGDGPSNPSATGDQHGINEDIVVDTISHPIMLLHKAAVKKYQDLLDRQSSTIEEAVAEYIRRYEREPPPGFGDWFQYAKENDVRIIDDYDLIHENLKPFWNVEPQLIRGAAEYAKSHDAPDLERFVIRDGLANTTEGGEWFGILMKDGGMSVPDIDILVNYLDEPRVLPRGTPQLTSLESVEWVDRSTKNTWKDFAASCNKSGGKPAEPKNTINTYGFPFITDKTASMDICQDPDLANRHGFFIGPTTMIKTESLIPVLSAASISTNADILFPSGAYSWANFKYVSDYDVDWKDKSTKMYWAGSTTGVYSKDFKSPKLAASESHRHRFISLTHGLDPDAGYAYLTRPPRSVSWSRYISSEPMRALYHTAFTKAVQCDMQACQMIRDFYGIQKPEDPHESLRYRFQMDLDGNSFSGRFYRLLASKSCPFKMTIFREWHDERLMPWLHYVPITAGMTELPETMRYLALTAEGDLVAQTIAAEGRAAHRTTLRQKDMAAYVYRLFLEYARVSSDDREQQRDFVPEEE